MPSDERVWTHDREQIPPLHESSQKDQCDARGVVRPLRSDIAFEIARELLPQEQVLGSQLGAGPGHQRQQPPQVSEEGKRRSDHVWR
jgi:hypothetical protein